MEKGQSTLNGSMTVEAAILLPIFIFFLVNILSILEMYRLHSRATYALWRTGREVGQYAYAGRDSDWTSMLSEVYAYGKVKKLLSDDGKTDMVWKSGIFTMLGTSVMEGNEDIVNLQMQLMVSPPFAMPFSSKFPLKTVYYGHVWTGYDLETKLFPLEMGEMVYITQSGTVYHRNAGCSYLNPSIQAVNDSVIDQLRNEDGGRYYPCPTCNPDKEGTLFITDYGDRFHDLTQCSGLKRTVYQVQITEAAGRSPCSKCVQ